MLPGLQTPHTYTLTARVGKVPLKLRKIPEEHYHVTSSPLFTVCSRPPGTETPRAARVLGRPTALAVAQGCYLGRRATYRGLLRHKVNLLWRG